MKRTSPASSQRSRCLVWVNLVSPSHQDFAEAGPAAEVDRLVEVGVPQSSEQKRTLSRADRQVVTVIRVTQRPQFTLSDALGQRE